MGKDTSKETVRSVDKSLQTTYYALRERSVSDPKKLEIMISAPSVKARVENTLDRYGSCLEVSSGASALPGYDFITEETVQFTPRETPRSVNEVSCRSKNAMSFRVQERSEETSHFRVKDRDTTMRSKTFSNRRRAHSIKSRSTLFPELVSRNGI